MTKSTQDRATKHAIYEHSEAEPLTLHTPVSASLHDSHDTTLDHTGASSVYQQIRLLKPNERALFDELFRQAEAGKGFDFSVACKVAKVSRSAVRGLEEKIPDIMRRLGLTEEVWLSEHLFPLLKAEETKFFNGKAGLVETPERPALEIRRDATFFVGRMFGALQRDDSVANVDSHDINVNIIHVGGDAKL